MNKSKRAITEEFLRSIDKVCDTWAREMVIDICNKAKYRFPAPRPVSVDDIYAAVEPIMQQNWVAGML